MKRYLHKVTPYLIEAASPITVNLIGAGGTGGHMLTYLARFNHALIQLGRPGLHVVLHDADVVTMANLARQNFAEAELGMNKAVALITRVNRFFGTQWIASSERYERDAMGYLPYFASANITISCVDTIEARYEIENILFGEMNAEYVRQPYYWIDLGNGRYSGQGVISTVNQWEQPRGKTNKYIGQLDTVTTLFGHLMDKTKQKNEPSCSLAEALKKQDLMINPTLANLGASMVWKLLTNNIINSCGFFTNLQTLITRSIPIREPINRLKKRRAA